MMEGFVIVTLSLGIGFFVSLWLRERRRTKYWRDTARQLAKGLAKRYDLVDSWEKE